MKIFRRYYHTLIKNIDLKIFPNKLKIPKIYFKQSIFYNEDERMSNYG